MFALFAFNGCGSVYGGEYKEVSSDVASEYVSKLSTANFEDGMKLNIDANVYGVKSKTLYKIAVKDSDLQMYGESDPLGIKTEFYYTKGCVYSKSSVDGEIVKFKQINSLEEVIFGTKTYPNIDGRISMELVFNPSFAVSTFAEDDDSKFYVDADKNHTKIKLTLSCSEYYPQIDCTINSTQTFYFVFDSKGNFTAIKVELKDDRVSRGYKEKSRIYFEIKRFGGEIELPSIRELETYGE